VFYGWPAVVVEDERHQRLVSSLFLRELDRPVAGGDANLAELGWTVIRIPAWRAALEPRGVADAVLAAAIGKR
jgi:hypothetical protein